MRPRPGVHRALAVAEPRVRAAAVRRAGHRAAGRGARASSSATSRRRCRPPAGTRATSGGSESTRASPTGGASPCSSATTTSARAPPSTPCRSPSSSSDDRPGPDRRHRRLGPRRRHDARRDRRSDGRCLPPHRLPAAHGPRRPGRHDRRDGGRRPPRSSPSRPRSSGRCSPPRPEVNRGYAARGEEGLSYSLGVERPPDLFEAFNIGPDVVDEADPAIAVERHRLFAPNIWPAAPATLRPALVAYFDAVRGRRRPAARRLRPGARPRRRMVPSVHDALDGHAAHDPLRDAARRPRPARRSGGHGRPHRLRHRHRAPRRSGARPAGHRPRPRVARRRPGTRRVPRQPRRPHRAVDERPLALDAAPRAAAGAPAPTG